MRAKLTAKLVGSLKPKAQRYSVRDTEIKGFLLWVETSGSMTYYLEYKTDDGRRPTYRIGRHGTLTPVQARDAAEVLAGKVALGIDIQAEKKHERAEGAARKYSTLGGFLEHKYEPWALANLKCGSDAIARLKHNFRKLYDRPLSESDKNPWPWLIEKWQAEQMKVGKPRLFLDRQLLGLFGQLALQTDVLQRQLLFCLAPVPLQSGLAAPPVELRFVPSELLDGSGYADAFR